MSDRPGPTGPDGWTAADDERVRAALTLLREDVTALPEPALVRARAEHSRSGFRRGWVAGVAAAAAAAAAVYALGAGPFDRGDDEALPGTPTPTATTAGSTTPTTSPPAGTATTAGLGGRFLDQPGLLPVGDDWRLGLGLSATPVVQDQKGLEGSADVCTGVPWAGTVAEDQRVVGDATRPDATLVGVQRRWTYADPRTVEAHYAAVTAALDRCTPTRLVRSSLDGPVSATAPRAWQFTVGGRQGYLLVAAGTAGVAYLEVPDGSVGDQATMRLSELAWAAARRLGSSPGATSTGSTGTADTACGVATAPQPDTTGANTAQAAKVRLLAQAVGACDTARLVDVLTTDRSVVSLGGLTAAQVLALPAHKDRYTALALVVGMPPAVDEFGNIRWPAEPRTDAQWAALVTAGLYAQEEVDRLRASGTGYAGWRLVLDRTGRASAFLSGD